MPGQPNVIYILNLRFVQSIGFAMSAAYCALVQTFVMCLLFPKDLIESTIHTNAYISSNKLSVKK